MDLHYYGCYNVDDGPESHYSNGGEGGGGGDVDPSKG